MIQKKRAKRQKTFCSFPMYKLDIGKLIRHYIVVSLVVLFCFSIKRCRSSNLANVKVNFSDLPYASTEFMTFSKDALQEEACLRIVQHLSKSFLSTSLSWELLPRQMNASSNWDMSLLVQVIMDLCIGTAIVTEREVILGATILSFAINWVLLKFINWTTEDNKPSEHSEGYYKKEPS